MKENKKASVVDLIPTINKIARSVARETDRSNFASVPIKDNDVPGGDLACHCLTTSDDLTAVAITNLGYDQKFAKKLLNQMLLEFREYFSFNPGMYLDLTADQPEWDTSLEFPTFTELFEAWQHPQNADGMYAMEQ